MKYLLSVLLFFALFSSAEAGHRYYKHRAHHVQRHHVVHHVRHHVHHYKVRRHVAHHRHYARAAAVIASSTIVAHPAGCPARAFCGCGAALRVFGHDVRDLWLAANWYRFPRTSPAPGTVAVRPHHVMVLEAELGPGVWQVYDANSGGHATRIHARSIAGYTIVQPRMTSSILGKYREAVEGRAEDCLPGIQCPALGKLRPRPPPEPVRQEIRSKMTWMQKIATAAHMTI